MEVNTNTLADEFMNDFEDDEEEEQRENEEERDKKKLKINNNAQDAKNENLLLKNITDITNIRTNEHFIKLMQVNSFLFKENIHSFEKEIDSEEEKGSQKEYQKISDTNEMIVKLVEDINDLYTYIKEIYSLKFKELAELETNKITYMKVVMRIGNETDLTKIELNDLLENSILLVITVAATTTKGRKLTEGELESVMMACKESLYLEEEKNKLLKFVEGKMEHLTPNLTTLVGSKVAASLVCSAGSLLALSKLPSSSVQSLGVNRKNLLGMSNKQNNFQHFGYIYQCPLVFSCPIQHRTKLLRILCGRVALAARFDAFQSSNNQNMKADSQGKKYKEEILNKISKWQEPPPPKKPKPLQAPDSKKQKKRGGEKARKKKQMMEQTQVRKHMNRISFNIDEGEVHYEEEDNGFGMLGQAMKGTSVRISAQENNIIKRIVAKKQRDEQKLNSTTGIRTKLGYKTGLKTLTAGAKSTLTLNDPNGMTFIATTGPSPLAENTQPLNTKYFTKTGNFIQLTQNKDKEFVAPLPKDINKSNN